MTRVAFTLSSGVLLTGEVAFTLYALLSFVIVLRCTARKYAAGRLINGRAAPLSLSIPPAGTGLLAVNLIALVVVLLFTPSIPYGVVLLAALLIFLTLGQRVARKQDILPPMGAWLFIVNVFALLSIQSPLYLVLIVTGQAVLLLENRRTAEKQFGFDRLTVLQLIKWSVFICGAVVVAVAPVMQLFEFALDTLHFSHPQQQSVEVFRQVTKPSQIFDFMVQAVLIAPLVEELFFRGFLLTYLKTYLSTWAAIVVTAGVFALAHQNLDTFLALWILGIVLGTAYEHTGSILLPIGIHASFNLTTGLVLLVQKVIS